MLSGYWREMLLHEAYLHWENIARFSMGRVKMGGRVLKHHQNETMMMASVGNFPALWAGFSKGKDCLELRPSSAAEFGRRVDQTTVCHTCLRSKV